jgi:two-component system nitrogen regulation response regulator NtrX
VLAEIKRIAPQLPVIIVSGYVTTAETRTCLALGASAVIKKPFDLDHLLSAFEEARRQR